MVTIVIVLVTFATGFFAVFAANMLLLDMSKTDQMKLRKRMGEELLKKQRERAKASQEQFKDLGELHDAVLADSKKEPHGIGEWFRSLVEQSGMNCENRPYPAFCLPASGLPANTEPQRR